MPVVTVPVAMRWSDMDAYGHVNNTEFFRYTEQARIEALALVKASPDTGTLVVRHEVEYLRPLTYHSGGVEVDVWITRIGGAGFDLGYEVLTVAAGEDGAEPERTVHARSASTMVMYSFSNAAPPSDHPGRTAVPRGAHGSRGAVPSQQPLTGAAQQQPLNGPGSGPRAGLRPSRAP